MRLQLGARRPRRFVLTVIAALTSLAATASAEDRVTVRGGYYREASTRVVQPVVELVKSAGAGFDVRAHYLLDAITSASVAAGVSTDTIFTEYRNEAGMAVGKTWGLSRLGLSYRYSAESDYWSHNLNVSFSQRVWGDTGTLAASLGRGFDGAASRLRRADCIPVDASGRALRSDCPLDIWFAGLSYAQVLAPTVLAQAGYELSYLDGYQGNLYRQVPSHGFDRVPEKRLRQALAVRAAKFFPRSDTGLQLHYRLYMDSYPGYKDAGLAKDPWANLGHMVEGRVFQDLGRSLEVRASYRWYRQRAAAFWCDFMTMPNCYAADARYYSADPKLAPMTTQLPELRLVWQARALARVPFFGWFASGSFEVSYGYLMQTSRFGDAHLLQTGYSMPL